MSEDKKNPGSIPIGSFKIADSDSAELVRQMFGMNTFEMLFGPFPDAKDPLENAKRENEKLKQKLEKYTEIFNKLNEEPFLMGTLVRFTVGAAKGLVSVGGSMMVEVNLPVQCEVGDQLRIYAGTRQPVARLKEPVVFGPVFAVDEINDAGDVFVSQGVKHRIVLAKALQGKVEVGDRLIFDPSGQVALKKIARDESKYKVEVEHVTWDDIGGLEDAKLALRRAVEYPVLHPELYARYNQKPPRGILLSGPPGCGKTHLGRAVACSIGSPAGFIYVKGTEVLDSYVGESERAVREIFARARDYKKQTGKPAVVFIDEADAILAHRGGGSGRGGSSFVGSMLVPTFLTEMDGCMESGAYVILATNRPDILDDAILRDGRIDNKIHVDRPNKDSAAKIMKVHMRGKPCADPDVFVASVLDLVFSNKTAFYQFDYAVDEKNVTTDHFTMANTLNGAMLKGFIRRAAELAIEREMKNGESLGLTKEDAEEAVREAYNEQLQTISTQLLEDLLRERNIGSAVFRKAGFKHGIQEEGFDSTPEFDGGRVRVQTPGSGLPN